MTSALMSALIHGTVTPTEGNAKLRRLDKRMNTIERNVRRGVNRLFGTPARLKAELGRPRAKVDPSRR